MNILQAVDLGTKKQLAFGGEWGDLHTDR